MKYIVTRDKQDSGAPIAMWDANAVVVMNEEGYWLGDTPATVIIEEYEVKEFIEQYGIHIQEGEMRTMERVVHWITEEE